MTERDSVHLENWPIFDQKTETIDNKLEEEMLVARKVVELGHSKRKELGVKVRVPMAKLEIKVGDDCLKIRDQVWDIVLKELNIKNIVVNNVIHFPKKEVKVTESELEYEGELRDFMRVSQSKRKEQGLKPTDFIDLEIPAKFSKDNDFIKRKLMIKR